ncbi:MAG: lytic transglycosylase domain-containing protein [Deltaproteobacteria bacterium]|jgi:hypothetical protein|nr:lytic transglycosylase domain-containing protein [Deltaproteobacteria bacterium]
MFKPLNIPSLVAILLALMFLPAACTPLDTPSSKQVSVENVRNLQALGQMGQPKTDFVLPAVVTLCGEIIPLERPAVRERLEYEFLLAVNHTAQVELWRRRAKRYFPLIEAALAKAGLPADLKYLAVAESDLRPSVSSPAGATGIWQFIPSTARQFGLAVNKEQDQRHLPEPLLQIGVRYLSNLHAKFGSWSLAMAAYNSGDARVAKAISSQGVDDYYQLNLPAETQRYVYRIAAIKVVLEGAGYYGFHQTAAPNLYKPKEFYETTLTFQEPITWVALARQYQTDYKTLRLLNPHISMPILKGGPFPIRLPQKPPTDVIGT